MSPMTDGVQPHRWVRCHRWIVGRWGGPQGSCARPDGRATMRRLLVPFLLAVLAVSVLPAASAEFGEEREGYPVNVDGDIVWPYIPADLAERHADLIAEVLSGSPEPLNKVNGYTVMPYY